MFGFLCSKTLRSSVVRSFSPVLQLHFSHNPSIFLLSSLRCFSTSENCANEHSLTVSYLINSCGLSSESALEASKFVHLKTLRQPDSILSFLKNHGFSETQIAKLVKKYPKVLMCNPEETLLPKLDFLRSKGFSSSDITDMLSTSPELLKRSLENQIIPAFNFFANLLQSEEKTVVAIKRCCSLLNQNFERDVASLINLLRGKGVSESNILTLFYFWPQMFRMNFGKVKRLVEEAMNMGFHPSHRLFVEAVGSLKGMSESTWKKKVDMYKKWNLSEADILAAFRKQPGFMRMTEFTWEKKIDVYKRWSLSEADILAAFRKQPGFIRVSEKKIMAIMDLFVNTLGWESSFAIKSPNLMILSLEKRLIPRASVLQFLISRGLVKKNYRSTAIFVCTETMFLKKFVHCYDEAPKLLKLYGEKLSLPRHQGNL